MKRSMDAGDRTSGDRITPVLITSEEQLVEDQPSWCLRRPVLTLDAQVLARRGLGRVLEAEDPNTSAWCINCA
jgi:hypothetical protein